MVEEITDMPKNPAKPKNQKKLEKINIDYDYLLIYYKFT